MGQSEGGRKHFDLVSLEGLTVQELQDLARGLAIDRYDALKKKELIFQILKAQTEQRGLIFRSGLLEVLPDGFGFLRLNGYSQSPDDVYVSQSQIKRFGLRTGDMIAGQVRPPKDSERYFSLLHIEALNMHNPESGRNRPNFEELTPIYPQPRYVLETKASDIAARILDLLSPIGKGQRGMIVSPPKAGKTTVLKQIAQSLMVNSPDVHLMVLLIDERPEEVTDIARSVDGEVIASTFDQKPENHMRLASLALERARRMVEHGEDVVLLLDSLTRYARASNLTVPPSGRTQTGGFDPAALYAPKHFFGAARKVEDGGSLTIIATILVDTGSRMDDYIFEEFKATGNMELRLDRSLAERGIFPAVNIAGSSTRHHELLLSRDELKANYFIRRILSALEVEEAAQLFIDRLQSTESNEGFVEMVEKEFRRTGAA
ncbi:MAG: transcription termination factor Rho [Armatimonadetes bacterium]|nr:transcription termination factor Rho [Armatimonadota bacterium]